MPNKIYECCTGPRRIRKGSRTQAPRLTAVQAGASSVKANACATESELSPSTQGQQRQLEWRQEWPPSTGPIRVDAKSGVNEPWKQRVPHVSGMSDTFVTTRRSLSLPPSLSTPISISTTLSSPSTAATKGIIGSSPPDGVSIADRDCGRETLPNIVAPCSNGTMQSNVATEGKAGVPRNYLPPSPASSHSSPSFTPSSTILPTTADTYSCHHIRDHLSASITTTTTAARCLACPPLFERGDAGSLGLELEAGMEYPSSPSSPSLTSPVNLAIQIQESPSFRRKQQLPSSGRIGGWTMSQYGPRTDTDSKAIDAFRPF